MSAQDLDEQIGTQTRRAFREMQLTQVAVREHAAACEIYDWPMAAAAALAASAHLDAYLDALQASHRAIEKAKAMRDAA